MLTQRTFLDSWREMGHPDLRHFEYDHIFSDDRLLDIVADMLADPVRDSDEEEFDEADLRIPKDMDCVPEMERPIELKFLETEGCCRMNDAWNTTTPMKAE